MLLLLAALRSDAPRLAVAGLCAGARLIGRALAVALAARRNACRPGAVRPMPESTPIAHGRDGTTIFARERLSETVAKP